ncbi:MAG: ribosome silencing factor [Candidatus Cloacimonadota bacterium]|nr:MAG: ribosome silencing factor [Candidatus Cloacimonadota bacterium]
MLEGYELAKKITELMLEKKAFDIKIIDLKGQNSSFDFFVLATGSVDQHIKTIADFVAKALSKLGVKPAGSEGKSNLNWVLLDYSEVIVHIFDPESREFYKLEKLFDDCVIEDIEEPEIA